MDTHKIYISEANQSVLTLMDNSLGNFIRKDKIPQNSQCTRLEKCRMSIRQDMEGM
jgi:hypothetical protein